MTTRTPHQHWCVYDYKRTLKQFNDTLHTHAKNNINSLKNSQPQILSKGSASFRPSETTHKHKGTFEMTGITHSNEAQGVHTTTKIERKDTNRPAQSTKTCHTFLLTSVSSHHIPLLSSNATLASSQSSASSPADFTAAASAALLPFALDQEGRASPEETAFWGSVVALCFAIEEAELHQQALQLLSYSLLFSLSLSLTLSLSLLLSLLLSLTLSYSLLLSPTPLLSYSLTLLPRL